jgi:tetratricopeptide (TPR) repeat protein
MKLVRPQKMWVWFGILTAVIILIAAIVVLFITAKLQSNLLTKTPNYDAPSLYNTSVAEVQKGDYATAEANLEQALKSQDDSNYRSELAVVKYRLKKYNESVDLYQQLITAGKDPAFAWNGIGNAYRDWADADTTQSDALRTKAIDAYSKAISLNAQYVASYSNLALLYESENKKTEALAILDDGINKTSSSDLVSTRLRIAQK